MTENHIPRGRGVVVANHFKYLTHSLELCTTKYIIMYRDRDDGTELG